MRRSSQHEFARRCLANIYYDHDILIMPTAEKAATALSAILLPNYMSCLKGQLAATRTRLASSSLTKRLKLPFQETLLRTVTGTFHGYSPRRWRGYHVGVVFGVLFYKTTGDGKCRELIGYWNVASSFPNLLLRRPSRNQMMYELATERHGIGPDQLSITATRK